MDFDEPLLRTVADELAALKRRVDRRVRRTTANAPRRRRRGTITTVDGRALRRRRLRDQALRRDAAGPQRGLLRAADRRRAARLRLGRGDVVRRSMCV